LSIIYIHGVKVRSPDHGIGLAKPFGRWLGPKLAVNGEAVDYQPVYWGDAAGRFRWNLESRPKTALLRAGGAESFAGLGSLREASVRTALDNAGQPSAAHGPVLNRPAAAPPAPAAPPLTSIPRDKRADFLADLYLVVHPRGRQSEDPIAEDARLATLADAAAQVAASWDEIIARETTDDARAARLISTVEARLDGVTAIG
jgi:hypothetical protein